MTSLRTTRHLPGLDHEKWYWYGFDRNDGDRRPWHHRGYWLHGPNTEAHVEYSLFRYNFGLGLELGRNGSESDIGLDLHAGKLASVYLRLRSPWTTWARIAQGKPEWASARKTGLSFGGGNGWLIHGTFEDIDGQWTKGQPWWRSWTISTQTIVGRDDCITTKGESYSVDIPLPEGIYPATATPETLEWRYRRFPGTWRDRLLGTRTMRSVDLKIEGGIPIEGKGESSWDCGMDGLFGCSGATEAAAIGNAVSHVLESRQQYGGPHNLTRATTVAEASGAA